MDSAPQKQKKKKKKKKPGQWRGLWREVQEDWWWELGNWELLGGVGEIVRAKKEGYFCLSPSSSFFTLIFSPNGREKFCVGLGEKCMGLT